MRPERNLWLTQLHSLAPLHSIIGIKIVRRLTPWLVPVCLSLFCVNVFEIHSQKSKCKNASIHYQFSSCMFDISELCILCHSSDRIYVI